jgi:hypothetical protein
MSRYAKEFFYRCDLPSCTNERPEHEDRVVVDQVREAANYTLSHVEKMPFEPDGWIVVRPPNGYLRHGLMRRFCSEEHADRWIAQFATPRKETAQEWDFRYHDERYGAVADVAGQPEQPR